DPASTETYTLSLHDALPISNQPQMRRKMPPFAGTLHENGCSARSLSAENRRSGGYRRGGHSHAWKSVSGSAGEDRYTRSAALERSEEHTSELQSRFDLVCRL